MNIAIKLMGPLPQNQSDMRSLFPLGVSGTTGRPDRVQVYPTGYSVSSDRAVGIISNNKGVIIEKPATVEQLTNQIIK